MVKAFRTKATSMNRSIKKEELSLARRVALLNQQIEDLDAALTKSRPRKSAAAAAARDLEPILLRPKLVTLQRLVHIAKVALSHLASEINPAPLENSPKNRNAPDSNNLKGPLKAQTLLANNGQE
jgi:uncharacterized small protein (DUF1192 family)